MGKVLCKTINPQMEAGISDYRHGFRQGVSRFFLNKDDTYWLDQRAPKRPLSSSINNSS
jgi:hypothetical protein